MRRSLGTYSVVLQIYKLPYHTVIVFYCRILVSSARRQQISIEQMKHTLLILLKLMQFSSACAVLRR